MSLVRGSTPIRAAGPGLWTNAAQRLRRDRLTLLAIFVLLALILLAVTVAAFLAYRKWRAKNP